MKISLLENKNTEWFITSLQKAFRQTFLDDLKEGEEIISREEIVECMYSENAESLQVEIEGKLVAGVVVKINKDTQKNDLDLFFIDTEYQGKGLGFEVWKAIEKRYPETIEFDPKRDSLHSDEMFRLQK